MDKKPNEKRSESKNPNSDAHKAMLDNRSAQIKQSSESSQGNQQQGGSGNGGTTQTSFKISER
jgi:hypothetical protein